MEKKDRNVEMDTRVNIYFQQTGNYNKARKKSYGSSKHHTTLDAKMYLTHFRPIIHFDTPLKRLKFSCGIEI